MLYYTVMALKKTKKPNRTRSRSAVNARKKAQSYETDSTYFLKLVVFVLLGTLWLKFAQPVSWLGLPMNGIPLGLLLGIVLVSRFEKYQPDRKIWYAILLVITILGYFVPAGIVI